MDIQALDLGAGLGRAFVQVEAGHGRFVDDDIHAFANESGVPVPFHVERVDCKGKKVDFKPGDWGRQPFPFCKGQR